MQETSFNYVSKLVYELLLECLFNFLENIRSNWYLIVFGPISYFFSKYGLAPWKQNTDRNGQNGPINRGKS